ncbi:protein DETOXIFICATION 22-like isoform X3 [Fagus crenata]
MAHNSLSAALGPRLGSLMPLPTHLSRLFSQLTASCVVWSYGITGYLKNAKVAIDALTICVRVANELGRGSSKAAKFSIVVTVLASFSIGFVLFLCFLFLRGRVAYIFTKNEEVVEAVADLSPLLAVSILLNSIQPVLSGVAVGAGWQNIVAYVNITCYYIVGIPVGLVLGYVFDMDVKVNVARNRVQIWTVEDAQEPKLTTSDVS